MGMMQQTGPPGPPGCGLAAAAFCDPFDQAVTVGKGRAGELDATRWSGSRMQPQSPTYQSHPFPIGTATLPACRAGLPSKVGPEKDTLICDPTSTVHSNHLLVASAAQNYGANSYRIRQPFDFAGRTGKIVFDATGYTQQLLGWISLEITEDPIGTPSYGVLTNDEGGILPQNGLELQFSWHCIAMPTQISLSAVHVFHDYADTVIAASYPNPSPAPCVLADVDKLNHFEVEVSQDHVRVSVSPMSADGVTFEPAALMFETPIQLSFSRGSVHLSTHNHATIKYGKIDAWVTRWDNVGFDGPVIAAAREYEIADALVSNGDTTNIGYILADEKDGPAQTFRFTGVDVSGASRARLALSSWYWQNGAPIDTYVLKYRLNGGAWHARPLTAGEMTAMTKPVINGTDSGGTQGALGQMVDLPLAELVAGDNTLEMVTANIPMSYPPGVVNLDLIID